MSMVDDVRARLDMELEADDPPCSYEQCVAPWVKLAKECLADRDRLAAELAEVKALVGELVECLDDELVCTRACHWVVEEDVAKRDELIKRAKAAAGSDSK